MGNLGWKKYVECEGLVVCIHKYYCNVHRLCTPVHVQNSSIHTEDASIVLCTNKNVHPNFQFLKPWI